MLKRFPWRKSTGLSRCEAGKGPVVSAVRTETNIGKMSLFALQPKVYRLLIKYLLWSAIMRPIVFQKSNLTIEQRCDNRSIHKRPDFKHQG